VRRLHDLVADTVANRLFRAMRVTEVSKRGPSREISLTSITPRVTSWTPGDKIEVRFTEDGLTMRTYTPFRWDNITGDTAILVYLHGAGPGSAWAQGVAAGDAVQIVGPRRSMDLTRFTSAPIIVGDETSVGLRVAWTAAHPNLEPVRDNFELGANSPTALRALGLEPVRVTREESDGHLPVLVEHVVAATAEHRESPLGAVSVTPWLARRRRRASLNPSWHLMRRRAGTRSARRSPGFRSHARWVESRRGIVEVRFGRRASRNEGR
jgi:ferric-chelate reductase (NADPH)